ACPEARILAPARLNGHAVRIASGGRGTIMAASKSQLTSMDDIARLANVAKSTVSRAFKDSPLVNPATKKRILAIARRHGYTVNANAQKLRTNRTNSIAVVMH